MKQTTPAKQLFTAFVNGYNERNLSALMSIFTKDMNVWGTGADECRTGLKEMEAQLFRDWSQSEKGKIEIVSEVPTNDEHWAAVICRVTLTIDGQAHTFDDFRTTIIVRKEENIWKISHAHSSFPDVRNPENGSFPVK